MSVDEKMTAIADAIRGYTGKSDKLNLDGMATGVSQVYSIGRTGGYEEGHSEGLSEGREQGYSFGFEEGKKAEYDSFWDVFQNYGNEAGCNYYYKFAYGCWTDDIYNPKYPIICASGSTTALALFYNATSITDTKVPITVLGNNAQSMFANASNLVTIRKFTVHKNVSFSTTFVNCTNLKNIEIGGTIGQDIDFQYAYHLSKESIKSIIEHLDGTASGKTVSFNKYAVNREFGIDVDDPSTYPEGSEYYALRQSKSNWTIMYKYV